MCLLHVEIAFDLGRNKKRPIPSLLPLETQCRFSRCRGPCSAWRSDGVTLPDPNVHPAWSVIVHTSASPQSPGDGQLETGAGAAIPRAPLGQVTDAECPQTNWAASRSEGLAGHLVINNSPCIHRSFYLNR